MKELVVEAKSENMEAVQDFVRSGLGGCPQKAQNQVAIVVDEIFSNIVKYAYAQEGGCVTVRIGLGEQISLEFEDGGRPYDPLSEEEPDLTLDADEREIGGLGLFMVKNLMDSVSYERKGNRNVLTVRKNLV